MTLHTQSLLPTAAALFLQVLGCVSLFFFGNVLSAIFAKLLSARFHKENHFKKMQQALTNVRPPAWLMPAHETCANV